MEITVLPSFFSTAIAWGLSDAVMIPFFSFPAGVITW